MTAWAESILQLSGGVALLLVFLIPALEASAFVGFLFPGEIACLLGGVLAFQGRVSLLAAVAAAITGAVLGDSVGYGVGRRYGDRILARVPPRLLRPDHVQRAKAVVNRLGGKAVFVGRFTAALRVLVPGVCGMARMPYRTFLTYNIAGGVLWAGGSVTLGYVAGAGWRRLEGLLSVAGYAAAGLVLGALFTGWLLRRRAGRRAHPSRSEPAEEQTPSAPGRRLS